MSEAGGTYSSASYSSQEINSFCIQKSAAACTALKQAWSDGRPARGLIADKRIFPLRPVHGNGRELLMVIPGPATSLWL